MSTERVNTTLSLGIGFDGTKIIFNYLRLLRGHVTKFLFRDAIGTIVRASTKL